MAKKDAESFREQLSRVRLMATGDPTWDLSDNDIAALKAVLTDRDRLVAEIHDQSAGGPPPEGE